MTKPPVRPPLPPPVPVPLVTAPCGCLVLDDEWCRICGGCAPRGDEWAGCCTCGRLPRQKDGGTGHWAVPSGFPPD
jgi:hypothetical protein